MAFKSLHITNAWHDTSGGIATFYRALLAAATAERQAMTLVVPAAADAVEDWSEGVRVYRVRACPAPLSGGYRLLGPMGYLLPRGRIAEILRRERPLLVEVCDKYTLPWLAGLLRQGLPRGAGRPTVVGLSCERMDDNVAAYLSGHAAARGLCRAYMKWFYFAMCDHHVAVSRYVAGELELAGRGHAVRRGVWIRPMGVDAGIFGGARRIPEARARLLAECGWPDGAFVLLYAGRLAPEKNPELLLECLRNLPEERFRLLIAGDGPLRAQLERDAAELGPGRVHFLGHVREREALAVLHANSDVFLHPNPREPFGIAPLEAMAAGTALVAPPSGGIATFANEDNAWLAPAEGEAFAAAVRAIAGQPELREAKTAAARRTALGFDWPEVAAGFLRLYRHLHLLREGGEAPAGMKAAFYSTPGDRFGRERRRCATHWGGSPVAGMDDSEGIHSAETGV